MLPCIHWEYHCMRYHCNQFREADATRNGTLAKKSQSRNHGVTSVIEHCKQTIVTHNTLSKFLQRNLDVVWFFWWIYLSIFPMAFPEYLQQTFFMSTPGISISYSSMFQPQLAETIPRAKKRRPKPAEISHNNPMPQNIFSGWQHSKAVQHSPGRSKLPRYPTSVADSRVGWPWRDSAKVQLTAFLVARLWSMDCCSLLPEVICWNDFLWTNSFHVFGGVEFLKITKSTAL